MKSNLEKIEKNKKLRYTIFSISILIIVFLFICLIKVWNIYWTIFISLCIIVLVFITSFLYDILFLPKTRGRGSN